MANVILDGQRTWRLSRDDNGFRTYTLVLRVLADSPLEGPASVLTTPGLPLPGSAWQVDNDFDLWVWCRPQCTVEPVLENEPNTLWDLTFTFSNQFEVGSGGPAGPGSQGGWRCHDQPLDNPLLMPPKISGGFVKYTEEQHRDMFGRPILNSAFEVVRGPVTQFDRSRATVRIEQNVLDLQLPLLMAMQDTVNAAPLWGLPRRCIKFTAPQWSEQYYGQCFKYFTRSLEFDIDLRTHDRLVMDEGSKVLSGEWQTGGVGQTDTWVLLPINGATPDRNNPKHFIQYKDRDGNPGRTMLNGGGLPASSLVPSGNKYIATGNAGLDPGLVGETAGWLRFNGFRASWNKTTTYLVGDVVQGVLGTQWLALVNNENFAPETNPTQWTQLTLGYRDRGFWESGTTYIKGDVVQTRTGTRQGSQIIRFYQEADFLLLGIPATIG